MGCSKSECKGWLSHADQEQMTSNLIDILSIGARTSVAPWFWDTVGKKCNGRNPAQVAQIQEGITLIYKLGNDAIQPIRGKYGYSNKQIADALCGRPGRAYLVGDGHTADIQAANMIRELRLLDGQQAGNSVYHHGKLKTSDTSKSFQEMKAKAEKAQADYLISLVIDEAYKLHRKWVRAQKKPAPKTRRLTKKAALLVAYK